MALVSDVVAEWLEKNDVRHAFGIIGGGNHILWNSIAERGFTEIVCVHHEQAAAMAATYYQRICGRMAAVLLTTGAGSTNGITGVMAAWMDRVPVIVLSGNENSKFLTRSGRVKGLQGYDSAGVAAQFTKASYRITAPSLLHDLEDAAKEATTQPGGPVWLDFPKDVQSAHV